MSLGFSPQRSAFMWTHPGRAVCGRPSRVESVTSIWTCVNVGHSQSCRLFTLESDEGLTCKTMTWTRTKKKQLSNKTCSVNVASVFLCNKMLFYRPDRVWKKGRVDDHDVTNSELLHEPKHLLSTHGLKSSSSDPALKVMKQKCDIALISRWLKDPESQLRSSKTWVGGRQEQRETEEEGKKKRRPNRRSNNIQFLLVQSQNSLISCLRGVTMSTPTPACEGDDAEVRQCLVPRPLPRVPPSLLSLLHLPRQWVWRHPVETRLRHRLLEQKQKRWTGKNTDALSLIFMSEICSNID